MTHSVVADVSCATAKLVPRQIAIGMGMALIFDRDRSSAKGFDEEAGVGEDGG